MALPVSEQGLCFRSEEPRVGRCGEQTDGGEARQRQRGKLRAECGGNSVGAIQSKAEAWFCLSPGPETLRLVIVIAKKCSYMTAALHF